MDHLKEAREYLRRGEDIPKGLIRDEIRESWMRCRSYHIDAKHHYKFVLTQKEVDRRIANRKNLCEVAFPHLDSLYNFVKGTNALISFCDEDGYILYHRGDPGIAQRGDQDRYTLGAAQTEAATGTNGLGTPLAIKKPIQILGAEHYLEMNAEWFGTGAPIFLPDSDEVCGAICYAGMIANMSDHTLGMVVLTAEAITRQLKLLNAYERMNYALQNMNVLIETLPEAALMVDQNANIKAYNEKAASMVRTVFRQDIDEPILSLYHQLPLSELDKNGEIVNHMITVGENIDRTQLAVSIRKTPTGCTVIQMEPAAHLARRINRMVGNSATFTFRDIIGQSASIKNCLQLSQIAAQNDINVFISGETGTGKELFAQAIHNESSRAGGPFIAVNCGALPKSLIEAELFGYEPGSFTGAKKGGGIGKFELANGGTLFLDEIGDMPFDVQATLLRALQEHEITRIGASKSVKIDIRVITATHHDLADLVEKNQFRSDLYYRINAFTIRLPSLRERKEDIPLLSKYFLKKYSENLNRPALSIITSKAMQLLQDFYWPGNIRQLENTIERSVYLAQDEFKITAGDLPDEIREPRTSGRHIPKEEDTNNGYPGSDFSMCGELELHQAEANHIRNALHRVGGNVKRASELLGISRRTLYRKLEKYQISADDFRSQEE